MYKVINKEFKPLKHKFKIDNIEKYEYRQNYEQLVVYTIRDMDFSELQSDGSLVIYKVKPVDSRANELDVLTQRVSSILNIDSHHC